MGMSIPSQSQDKIHKRMPNANCLWQFDFCNAILPEKTVHEVTPYTVFSWSVMKFAFCLLYQSFLLFV